MASLQIQLRQDPHSPNWNNVPVSADIINTNLEIEEQMVLWGSKTLDIAPGFYLVRAYLPSGEIATAQTFIREQHEFAEIIISTNPSPHEWLAWQNFLGEVPSTQSQLEDQEQTLSGLPPIWLRLWIYDGRSWKVLPATEWLNYSVIDDPRFGFFTIQSLNRSSKKLPMVQIGGPTVPMRMINLPPTDSGIEILLRASRTPTELNGGVAVKVVTGDQEAETLSHYLRSGSFESAEKVAGDLIENVESEEGRIAELVQFTPPDLAEEMLRDKLRNPYAALVGGYYLLKVGAYERMHNWPNNFANWFKWIPDAAIIHAWQLFAQEGTNQLEQARERLLQAAHQGRPLFTEGMRYLIDGLEICANIAREDNGVDESSENALRDARRYAGGMDWLQRFLTFYGRDPSNPSLNAAYENPEDTSGEYLVRGPNW